MRGHRWTLALAILSVAFVLYASIRRDSLSTMWGDESTYVAMAESLARDGDLRFDEDDASRLTSGEARLRSTVILQQSDGVTAYSKPVLYALLAAPGVLAAGRPGLILVNVGLLSAALWAAWPFLCRLGDRRRAALTLVTFVGASSLLAHLGWQMSDLLQAALSLAGLSLALATLRRQVDGGSAWLDRAASAWLGGALLGMLISARLPNALIAVAALGALVVSGRPRRAARVGVGAAAGFLALVLLSQALTGAPDPYRAVRSSFDATSGYPVGEENPAGERFETHRTTQVMSIKPRLRPSVTAYASLYFLVGRHSGLVWYFPALLALVATALWRPDRITVVLLIGAVAASAFYLIWWPNNYFGGSTFLGNRYFLPVYPMLLMALPRLPGKLSLTLAWLLASVVGGSAVWALATSDLPTAASQSHTRAGLLARAPYESTGQNIDGRRDRYWARDLVRFVQPVAGVGKRSFVLETGKQTTELLVVTRRADAPMLLRYRTRTPGLELVVRSADGEQRFALDRGGRVRRGSLTVPLGAAWRRHAFWWDEVERYAARSVRLSIVGAAGGEAQAEFWYGGDPLELEKSFDYTARDLQLPAQVEAGSSSELVVALRNTSPVPWSSAGAYPVALSYRISWLSGEDRPPSEGPRIGLAQDLPSGDPVRMVLPVSWPSVPGRYRLKVDLVIEDYAWFESHLDHPMAQREVEVVAPVAP